MNDEFCGFPIHIEYYRYSFIITIMCGLELAIVVLQHQNMGNALLIKLYLTIPFTLYLWVVLIHSPFILTFVGLFVVHNCVTSFLLQNRLNLDLFSIRNMVLISNSCLFPTFHNPNCAYVLSSSSISPLYVYCINWMGFLYFSSFERIFYMFSYSPCHYYHHYHTNCYLYLFSLV